MLTREYFQNDLIFCARELVGCELRWGECGGLVVETEAYAASGDAACHTFFKKGAREFVNSQQAGSAYIYLNYGMHWMLNVLVKHGDDAGFVLIRALEPTFGLEAMRQRRPSVIYPRQLCSGPGKLTKALGIGRNLHGFDLTADPAHAFHPRSAPLTNVLSDVRVGISRAADFPWRFLHARSDHVSIAHGKVKVHLTKTQRMDLASSRAVGPSKNTKSQAG